MSYPACRTFYYHLLLTPMKNLLRSLAATLATTCLLVVPVRAQQAIPNGNFETWTTRNGVEAPASWLTTDDFLGGVFRTGTVTKTTVARGGAFAAQLQTQSVLGIQQFPGLLILGTAIRSGATVLGGVPYTSRPGRLQFYYQLSGSQALADSAAMVVVLTRRVNGTATVVAGGSYTFTALAASYTQVSVPLQYASNLAPDSVSLVFYSGDARNVTAGTTLRIDDVAFTGTATATRNAALDAALTVAPNPSPDGRYQLSSPTAGLLAAPLTVLDATGRVVRCEAAALPAPTTRTLDLSALPGGIYTIQLLPPTGLVTRHLTR